MEKPLAEFFPEALREPVQLIVDTFKSLAEYTYVMYGRHLYKKHSENPSNLSVRTKTWQWLDMSNDGRITALDLGLFLQRNCVSSRPLNLDFIVRSCDERLHYAFRNPEEYNSKKGFNYYTTEIKLTPLQLFQESIKYMHDGGRQFRGIPNPAVPKIDLSEWKPNSTGGIENWRLITQARTFEDGSYPKPYIPPTPSWGGYCGPFTNVTTVEDAAAIAAKKKADDDGLAPMLYRQQKHAGR